MKNFLIVLTFVSVAALAAQAQTEAAPVEVLSTELAQPSLGQRSISEKLFFIDQNTSRLQITPGVVTTKSTYKSRAATFSRETTTQIFNFAFEKGISESEIALGFSTSFANNKVEQKRNKTTNEFKNSGLGDIQLEIKGISENSKSNLIYGGALTLSPGNAEYAYRTQDGNMYSGGTSFKPFLNYESETSIGSAGLMASYQFWGQRKTVGRPGDDEIKSGGNVLAFGAFTEYALTSTRLGLAANYEMTASTDYEITEDFEKFESDGDATQNLTLSAYGRFDLSKTSSIKPEISYDQLLSKNINGVDIDKNESIDTSIALAVNF